MRLRLALILAVTVVAAAMAQPEPSIAFPKPPATLLVSLLADDTHLLTLWQLPGEALRLGLATRAAGGEWELPLSAVKALDVAPPAALVPLALPSLHPHAVAVVGRRAEVGRVNLVAYASGKVSFLLAADQQPGQAPSAADVDGDGQSELLLVDRATLLWPDHGPWLDRHITAYRAQADGTLRAAPFGVEPDDPRGERLALLREARQWPAAVQLATTMAQGQAGDRARWNLALTRYEAGWYAAQADALLLASNAGDRVASGLAEAYAGRLDQAAERLLSVGDAAHLPDGWQTAMTGLGALLDTARRATPSLGDSAGFVTLRGFVAASQGLDQAARTAWRRAAALRGDLPGLAQWLGGSRPLARLWLLDARDTLHAVDVTADGQPAGPLAPLKAVGPLAMIAGSPAVPGLIALSANRQQVVATSDGQTARVLAQGTQLELQPNALSPDGRWVVIGEQTAEGSRSRVISAASGDERVGLRDAAGFLWSPDSRQLAVSDARGVRVVGIPNGPSEPLAAADDQTVWTLLDWTAGQPLRALRHRLARGADGQPKIVGTQRVALRPGSQPTADDRPNALEELAQLVMLRTRAGQLTQPLTAAHPTLLAWRAGGDQRTMLYVGTRTAPGGSVVAPTEPFDHRLRAAWSRAPEPQP